MTGDIVAVDGGIDLASFSNSTVTVSGLPAPAVSSSIISPTGGTLVGFNNLSSQERMQSVYFSGLRQNSNRY